MKKILFLSALSAALLFSGCSRQATRLEVSFDYHRMDGGGSNQYAVWVENDGGEVVKTLFVTSFTTKGRAREGEELVRGYIKRPYCVPTWVKHARAEELTDEQLDAFTGATPAESGTQVFTWDLTDPEGNPVEPGKYTVFVEATLHDPSRVSFCGTFNIRKKGDVEFTSTLTEPDDRYEGMISNVRATLQ